MEQPLHVDGVRRSGMSLPWMVSTRHFGIRCLEPTSLGRAVEEILSRLAYFVLAITMLACVSPPPSPSASAPPDSRPPLIRLADSTSTLVARAASVSDSANMHAKVALATTSADRARAGLESARNAARAASLLVESAIAQGEYISNALPAASGAAGESAGYTRYWKMGREKLDLAYDRATSAAERADLALACASADCMTTITQELQSSLEQVAGASREAESLVRIAMVYVGMAMSFAR